jgi:uncharacterized protein (TIGR00369 family)
VPDIVTERLRFPGGGTVTATDGGTVERVRQVLDDPLHRWLGLELADEADPWAGLVFAAGPAELYPGGLLHGGMLAALLDVAAGVRLLPELADGETAVTHAASCSVLRPVPAGTRLLLRADLLSKSPTRAFLRSSACAGEEAVAVGQLTKDLLPG